MKLKFQESVLMKLRFQESVLIKLKFQESVPRKLKFQESEYSNETETFKSMFLLSRVRSKEN